jgi:3-oxoacyl-(acyl-carrier-protein) synthase
MMIGNMAWQRSIHFRAKGINYVTTTACASANHALGSRCTPPAAATSS